MRTRVLSVLSLVTLVVFFGVRCPESGTTDTAATSTAADNTNAHTDTIVSIGGAAAPATAARFSITFQGLIAHIRHGQATRAVMVEAMNHQPLLIVKESDVVAGSIKGFSEKPVSGVYSFKLSTEFTMDPKPAKAPKKIDRFNQVVPSLRDVLNKPPDADALLGKVSHPGVFASLDYAGGDEDAATDATIGPAGGCFLAGAKWSGGDAAVLPACIARKVAFSFDTTRDVTISDGTNSVTIRKEATGVEITNNFVPRTGNHFASYAKLATGSTAFTPSKKPLTTCNSLCEPHETGKTDADPDVDCSNSHFP